MLVNLHVKNMALIKEEEITLKEGLNILTGETGAGKSIMIGSVNVALGQGSFKDYAPEDSDALVELVFETDSPAVKAILEENEIPFEDGQVIISRKYHSGRTISRLNGETVPMKVVRDVCTHLIDIHGQHQHQSLLQPKFHRGLLDKFAAGDLKDLPRQCSEVAKAYRKAASLLKSSQVDDAQRLKQIDLLEYEIREIEEAALVPGEDEDLENSFRRMENGQKIMGNLSEASQSAGVDSEAADLIGRAVRALSTVSGFDPQLSQLSDEAAQLEDILRDFGRSLQDYMDEFTYDEQEFYRISGRLDLINHLKQKYGRTIEDILSYLEANQEKVQQLKDYENYKVELEAKMQKAKADFANVCAKITKVRKSAASVLEKRIEEALKELNFLDVKFVIGVEPMKEPDESGADEVTFLISVNPGMPVRPLWEVASGGELSRIMLAIKSVMADQDEIGTLIFDEIDTGISGRTAQKVSERMAVIAKSHQVICITHLAQIAAMADAHFEISKGVEDGRSVTSIRQLDLEKSEEELARILGGVSITDSVRKSAQEMKKLADERKSQL